MVKVLSYLIKKHLIWMALSYLALVGVIQTFILIPQHNTVEKYKTERAQMEYDFMKITGSPTFMNTIENTLNSARIKAADFEWVENDRVDPSLSFYNHLSLTAEKNGVEVTGMKIPENQGQQKKKEENIYHIFEATLEGPFPGVLKFIEDMESNGRFIIIEEVSVQQASREENETAYRMVFLCLKKSKHEK